MATAASVTVAASTISAPAPREEKTPALVLALPAGGATAGAFPTPHAAATAASIVSQMASCRPHLNALSELFGEKIFKELGKLTVEQVCTLALIHCITRVINKTRVINEQHAKVIFRFLGNIKERKWRAARMNMGGLIFALNLISKNEAAIGEYTVLKPALEAVDSLLTLDMWDTLLNEFVGASDSQDRAIEFCAKVHYEWTLFARTVLKEWNESITKLTPTIFPASLPTGLKNKKTLKQSGDPLDLNLKSTCTCRCSSYFVRQCASEVITHGNHLISCYKNRSRSSHFKEEWMACLAEIEIFEKQRFCVLVPFLSEYALISQLRWGIALIDTTTAQQNVRSYYREKRNVQHQYLCDVACILKKLTGEIAFNPSLAKSILYFLFEFKMDREQQKQIDQLRANTQTFESLTSVRNELHARDKKLDVDMQEAHIKHFKYLDIVLPKNALPYETDFDDESYITRFIVKETVKAYTDISPSSMSDFTSMLHKDFTEVAAKNHELLEKTIPSRMENVRIKARKAFGLSYVNGEEQYRSKCGLYVAHIEVLITQCQELHTLHSPVHLFFHQLFQALLPAAPSVSMEEALKDPHLFIEEKKLLPKQKKRPHATPRKEKPEEPQRAAAAAATAVAALQPEEPRIFKLLSSLLFQGQEDPVLSYHLNHIQWSLELIQTAAQKEDRAQLTAIVPALIYHLYLVLEIPMTAQILDLDKEEGEEGETRLFHGLDRMMRYLGRTEHLEEARLINYATFWFRFPHSSCDNYRNRVPRVLQLMIDLEKQEYDCKRLQRELEGLVHTLLPLVSPVLHTNMVTPAAVIAAPLPKDLQNVVDQLEGNAQALKQLLASKQVLLARPGLRDALSQLIRLKEQIKMLPQHPIQRYYSSSTDNLLLYSYLVVKLMGAAYAKEGGIVLQGIHDIEAHWDMLELDGQIEGVRKEQIKELNLQKAEEDPTTVPEFMRAYAFACAATEGGEGMIPDGYSGNQDLSQKLGESVARRTRTVIAFVTYILNQLSES